METPERLDMIAHFPAWVYEPNRLLRYRGFATNDLWIFPNRLVVVPRRLKPFPRPHGFKDVEYSWPTVVIETLRPTGKPLGTSQALIEIHGQLGSVSVRGRRRFRRALQQAGFKIIEVTHWGWEAPHQVPARILGAEVGNVPPSVVSQDGDGA
jgi:hypothetical protein